MLFLFWDGGPLFRSSFWTRARATNSDQRSIQPRPIVNCWALNRLVWYPQCLFLSSTRWFLPGGFWHSRAHRGGIRSHRRFLEWYWNNYRSSHSWHSRAHRGGIRNHRKFLEWYRNSYRSSCSGRTCFGRTFYWRFCRWSQLISNKPLRRPIWPTIALLIITTWFPIWNKATYKGTFYVEVFVEDRCHIPGVYVVSTSGGLSQGNLKPRHDVSSSYITCIYTLINSG